MGRDGSTDEARFNVESSTADPVVDCRGRKGLEGRVEHEPLLTREPPTHPVLQGVLGISLQRMGTTGVDGEELGRGTQRGVVSLEVPSHQAQEENRRSSPLNPS